MDKSIFLYKMKNMLVMLGEYTVEAKLWNYGSS